MVRPICYKNQCVKVYINDPNEYIQKHWMNGNFYECGEGGLLRHFFEKYQGCTFIDVGACIGNHTLFMAKLCKAKKVYSFEPVPNNYKHLIDNVKLNKLDNVQIYLAGLSDYRCKAKIKLEESGNAGSFKVGREGEEIQLATLNGCDKVDVIKIDVEGMNVRVIRGMSKYLQKHKPHVYIEAAKGDRDKTDKAMAMIGYSRQRGRWNPTPTYFYAHKDDNRNY